MTFYEQTNNTEWGKVILVRLIFAPFMNSMVIISAADDGLMDGRSRVILPQANTYLEASGPSALTL